MHAQRGVAESLGKSLSSENNICAYHLYRCPLREVQIGGAENVKFMSLSMC